MLLMQLSGFSLYFLFSKTLVGELQVANNYANFLLLIALLGSDQSLSKRIIHKDLSDYSAGIFVYAMLFTIISLLSLYYFHLSFQNDVLTVFLAESLILILVLKVFEVYTRVEGKLRIYYIKIIQYTVYTLILYIFLGVVQYLGYKATLFHFIVVKLILLLYMLLTVNATLNLKKYFNFHYTKNIASILKKDVWFIILMAAININLFIDKLMVAHYISFDEFAEYSLIVSIVLLLFMPKIVLSNNYLRIIKHEKIFSRVVRLQSLYSTLFLSVVVFCGYYIIVNYFISYGFHYLLFLVGAVCALIDAFFGPNGMILQYNYSPKYVLKVELIGLLTLLILVSISLFLEDLDYFSFFFILGMFIKAYVSSLRFLIYKQQYRKKYEKDYTF